MELFKKKKTITVEENNNFNRAPLRSQSQCMMKKRNAEKEKDATLSRSQTFTIGLPVYSIENDPLGTAVDGPLSQASSGYLSINGEVTSPTDSNVSLFSEQKSDYGGSTSEVSGVSSVDSETLNIIYASRYHALRRQSQTLEKLVPVNAESVPFQTGAAGNSGSSKRRESSRSSSRGESASRHDSFRSTNSSGSQGTTRSDSIRSSRSSRSADSGHSSRIRSPEGSVRSYRSSSSSSTGSSSSSRVSRVRYGDSGRSRHSKIPEEPDPYFTKGLCSSFREDGSAEVRVRGSPDFEQSGEKVVRRHSRSNSFRRSKPCLSMLRDHTQSLEGLDRIEGESTLDRKSRRDARSVGNLVQVPVPTVPSDYESAGTLRRNAKSVGNLIGSRREAHLESSHSTGDLLNDTPSGERSGNKKDAFFKRGIFKLFRKKSSDSDKAKKEKNKSKVPKSKSGTLDYESRRGSSDTLTNMNTEIIDTKSKYETLQSRSSTLRSQEGTLTRANANSESSRERNELRDSRDFDRNDSLERAIRSNDQSGTLTRDNCNDRRSKDLTEEDPYGKVGALNAILRQSKSPSIVRKRAAPPPLPPNRTSRSKSTYQILDEIKAQNAARNIESLPIPDDPPTPEGPSPPSPVAGVLKRTVPSRDSKSLGVMAQKSDTLKRHHSRNLENLDDTYDLPPPPEELIAMGVDAPRPNDLPIGDKQPKSILKTKTPSDELCSPRDLKNALNEPFYARSQQRRSRPNCPPPIPPHSEKAGVAKVQVHQEHRPGNNDIGQQLRTVRLRPTADRPPVPVHQNLDLKAQIQSANLRKRPETKPKSSELETVLQNSLNRRSKGNVLDNNINEEIKNVVLRRTSPTTKEPELHSQLKNVVLRKTQNRASLRNSIVMDPSALLHAQSQPAAVVHQSKPNTVHMVNQPRPQTSAFNQPRPEERNSVFDALNEHSGTLRRMSKPNIPRKPSFNDSHFARLNDTYPKESVYGIMDDYMESRKSLGSQKSIDSEESVDFPPPPPPMCDYNAVVDC